MVSKYLYVYVCGTVLLSVNSLYASDEEQNSIDFSLAKLDPIVVTATRTAQTANESLASVTVITRKEIEESQVNSFEEVIRNASGLNIGNNGGLGKDSSIFLRGTESDHVLLLIDGIKVGSATSGKAAIQDIPLDQIDRIEIVRGPRSSLYGSEAIGGVIQIFTKKGKRGITPTFSVKTGSHETYKVMASAVGGDDRNWFNLTLSSLDTQGYNACDGYPPFSGCGTIETDDDGYRNLSSLIRFGHKFTDSVAMELYSLRSDSRSEYDGSYQNQSESSQKVYSTKLVFDPVTSWRSTLQIGRNNDNSDNFHSGEHKSTFNTERDSVTLQNDIKVNKQDMLSVGVDYKDDKVNSTEKYDIDSRDNIGFFYQYAGAGLQNNYQISLRMDEYENIGKKTTGNIAWGYKTPKNVHVFASYGTAYKTPSFNELYFPGYGNPNLNPEESESIEFGFKQNLAQANWAFNAYRTTIDNLIAYDSTIFGPANIEQAKIFGIEANASVTIHPLRLTSNLTIMRPKNTGPGFFNGNTLPRRSKESANLDASYSFRKFKTGITLHAEGKRYDDVANTHVLGGYAVVDLRGEYVIDHDWMLQARIANLFDKEYETAAYYNQEGRSLYVTLRYQPRSK